MRRTAGIYQFAPFQQFGPLQPILESTRCNARRLSNLQRTSASPENAARILTTIDEISIRPLLRQVAVLTIVFRGRRVTLRELLVKLM